MVACAGDHAYLVRGLGWLPLDVTSVDEYVQQCISNDAIFMSRCLHTLDADD